MSANKTTTTPAVGTDATTPEQFEEQVRNHLKSVDRSRKILVTIPVWGWFGAGKTSAILTAVRYSGADLLFDLSPLADSDEAGELENARPEYASLGLAAVVTDSSARMRKLSQQFIDASTWVPGTEEPSIYVLAVRTAGHLFGYALLPDIKGGSFQEHDAVAKTVLAHPHAAVVMVSPTRYRDEGTEGKEYRAAVLAVIQKFARARVPVCVMITQSDRYLKDETAVADVQNRVTVILDSQDNLDFRVFRVSVIGDEVAGDDPDALPPAPKRKPRELMNAWFWVIGKALLQKDDAIAAQPLTLNLADVPRGAPVAGSVSPELRASGDYSSVLGRVLCHSGDSPSQLRFLFLSGKGELAEVDVPATQGDPVVKPAGSLADWKEVADLESCARDGRVFVGQRRNCNSIWTGVKGQTLSPASFASELLSWTPVSGRRIVGIDASGRLQSLEFEASEFRQRAYFASFVAPSPNAVCAYDAAHNLVVVFTGGPVEGIHLDANGQFGDRMQMDLVCKFDSPRVVTNRLGLCAAISKDAQCVLSAPKQQVEAGAVANDSPMPMALASDASTLAVLSSDLRLSILLPRSPKPLRSAANRSPVLKAAPAALCWTPSGRNLIATYPDGTWSHFRVYGIDR